MRKTKIVCTIGPATCNPDILEQLILAGMDAARINFSHGTYEEKNKEIKFIKQISNKLNKNISIIQDLCGPKIRVGDVENNEIALNNNENIILTTMPLISNSKKIFINYSNLIEDIQEKDLILLDDGKIKLIVTAKKTNELVCEIISGGKLKSKKGVNFPNRSLSVPVLTNKDIEDIKFGISKKVNFIALSFVRHAEDIDRLRNLIKKLGYDIPIIAKIEKHEAIENIDSIIEMSDGIMVARGDLGVEVPIENVPIYQKMIIGKSNRQGKPVITATQMLESMIENQTPTRAEVTDISNAILDGTDAIMLSAETSIGKYPIECVKIMVKVAQKTEEIINYNELNNKRNLWFKKDIPDAIAHGACQMAQDLSLQAIITFTDSGFTARMISKYRPKAPIYVFTPNKQVAKIVNLFWGVKSFIIKKVKTTDAMFKEALDKACHAKVIKKGDLVILTAGVPIKEKAKTNLIRIIKVS